MSSVPDATDAAERAPEHSTPAPVPDSESPQRASKGPSMIASRASEAVMGPSGPQGIASIFEQFELPGRTAGRQSPMPADPEKFSLSNLNKEVPSLGPPQMQSATIGWTQMLQMLGTSSTSVPPIQLQQAGGPSVAAAQPAGQLPQPTPLFPHGQPQHVAEPVDPQDRALPAASPFAARNQPDASHLGAFCSTSDMLEGPSLAARTTQRRAKLRAQARVKDDADADWEMEEEEAEPEWKEPASRNTKEPKVNVRPNVHSAFHSHIGTELQQLEGHRGDAASRKRRSDAKLVASLCQQMNDLCHADASVQQKAAAEFQRYQETHKACSAGRRKGIRVTSDTIPTLTILLQPPKTKRLNGVMLEFLLLASIGRTDAFPALATPAVLERATAVRVASPITRPVTSGSLGQAPVSPVSNTRSHPTHMGASAALLEVARGAESAAAPAGAPAKTAAVPFGSVQPASAEQVLLQAANSLRPDSFMTRSGGSMQLRDALAAVTAQSPHAARPSEQGLALFAQRPPMREGAGDARQPSPPSPQLLDLSTIRQVADRLPPFQPRPLSSGLQIGSARTSAEGGTSTEGAHPASATGQLLQGAAPLSNAPSLSTLYRGLENPGTTGSHASSGPMNAAQAMLKLETQSGAGGSGPFHVPVFDSTLPGAGGGKTGPDLSGLFSGQQQPQRQQQQQPTRMQQQGSPLAGKRPLSTDTEAPPAKRHTGDFASGADAAPSWNQMYDEFIAHVNEVGRVPQSGTLGVWTARQLAAAHALFSNLPASPMAQSLGSEPLTREQYVRLANVPAFLTELNRMHGAPSSPHLWTSPKAETSAGSVGTGSQAASWSQMPVLPQPPAGAATMAPISGAWQAAKAAAGAPAPTQRVALSASGTGGEMTAGQAELTLTAQLEGLVQGLSSGPGSHPLPLASQQQQQQARAPQVTADDLQAAIGTQEPSPGARLGAPGPYSGSGTLYEPAGGYGSNQHAQGR